MAGRVAAVSLYVFYYCLLHLSEQGKCIYVLPKALHMALPAIPCPVIILCIRYMYVCTVANYFLGKL